MVLMIINLGKLMQVDINDWDALSIDKVKFIMNSAEKRLQGTIEIKKTIEDKSFKMIQTFITLITASIGFFINLFHSFNYEILIPLFCFILSCFGGLLVCSLVFNPRTYYLNGNKPSNMLKQKLIEQEERFVIYNELYNYQNYIELNDQQNKFAKSKLKGAILVCFLGLWGSFLFWGAIKIIKYLF